MTSGEAGLFRQTRALVPFALGNIWRARWSSLTIIVCVMLVVIILSAFLSMARGFAATAESAGSDAIIIFLSQQSPSEANSQVSREQIELLGNAPGVLHGETAGLSPELTMTVSGHRRTDRVRLNATLRGLTRGGLSLHEGFRLVAGRLPAPGRYELIVGRKLAETTAGTDVGDTTVLAGRRWSVVGRYALASPVFETEYLADLASVQSAYGRENQYQTVRARRAGADGLALARAFVAADPRLDLDARTERQLYAEQVKGTTDLIMYLGWPLAAMLSVGALAGVFNTMFIVLEGRRHSLKVVRMLGFSPQAVMASVVLETILLAVIGALVGTFLVFLAVRGLETTVMGSGFTTITYNLRVDAAALLQSLALAIVIGVIGGAVPSRQLNAERKA